MLGCTTVRCCSHKLCAVAAEDLDEMNIEIMRNTLYKAYLDDFAKYCNKMGGSTSDVMGDLLSFEVRMLTHSLTHPPTHSLTHPPLTHLLTYILTLRCGLDLTVFYDILTRLRPQSCPADHKAICCNKYVHN